MALPERFNNMSDVPEPFREMYTFESGNSGPVVLSSEYQDMSKMRGALENERKERAERQTRIDQISGQLKTAEEKLKVFDGLDPERARAAATESEELKARLAAMEAEALKADGKHAEAAELKFQGKITSLENRIEAEQMKAQKAAEERAALISQLDTYEIDGGLSEHLQGRVKDTALKYVLGELRKPWKRDPETNKPQAYDESGKPMYGKDSEPLSMKEYAENFLSDPNNAFALRESSGAGIIQNGRPGGGNVTVIDANQIKTLDDYKAIQKDVQAGRIAVER
jgi:hypothetical protein